MNTLNIVAGVATLISLIFSLWIYWESRKKQAIEKQKNIGTNERLRDLHTLSLLLSKQASMIATLADREDVTKKELKHLSILLLSTSSCLQGNIGRDIDIVQEWKFGVPERYSKLESSEPADSEHKP